MLHRLVIAMLIAATLAGCLAQTEDPATTASVGTLGELVAPVFAPTKILDNVRAGGEPVIAITPKGTILVAAHPGFTHTRYPPSLNLLEPVSTQSYMWRSTDNGTTFKPVGLPLAPDGQGPRGVGQGVSDPDFAIDTEGRIYFTDLEALAAASVSWSDDDGATWLQGNDAASLFGGTPVDRNWIATHGTTVYFMGNYGGEKILKSEDGGLTWTEQGAPHCEQQFITTKKGDVLVGCPNGLDHSNDQGKTWQRRDVPGAKATSRGMSSPALDAAENVYVTWADDHGIWIAGSRDLGQTWTQPLNVAEPLNLTSGTNVWPWIVAGDEGRVAVYWYATSAGGGPAKATGDWYVYGATVLDAMSAAPRIAATKVTASPIFKGHICQNGTGCQADPSAAGDRRLGDFFEAAIDKDGYVHVVYAVALDDSISHPGYSKQVGGPSLHAANATLSVPS